MNFDSATALSLGQRESQQDAVTADFNLGDPFGFVVLSDGMGGHAAGDMASKIVVTEMFSELKLKTGDCEAFERDIAKVLRDAVRSANDCISAHVIENPAHRGMGATVLASVIFEDRMYWASVGDSPLFLFRAGKLERLNEDHSMAPQIDAMAKTGQLSAEVARNHPDRGSLMSVLIGSSIPKLDCRSAPYKLTDGDIILAASDGVNSLEDRKLATEIGRVRKRTAAEIAEYLLEAVRKAGLPKQDNTSLGIIKIE